MEDSKRQMMGENKTNYEKLFLFEFLVDSVSVFNSKLSIEKATLSVLGPVAVRFQFLDYPPIEICEESFAAGTKPLMEEKSILMKSGKSCMFSLSSLKSKKISGETSLDVRITVYQYKLQKFSSPGQVPPKPEEVFIGRTKTDLADIFKQLLAESMHNNKKLTRTRTACNKLVDNQGTEVGKLMFVVRVSCFGFMLMTGFQLSEEERKDFKYKHIEYDQPDSYGTSTKLDETGSGPYGDTTSAITQPHRTRDHEGPKSKRHKSKGNCCKKHAKRYSQDENKSPTKSCRHQSQNESGVPESNKPWKNAVSSSGDRPIQENQTLRQGDTCCGQMSTQVNMTDANRGDPKKNGQMGISNNIMSAEERENYEKLFLFEFLVDHVQVYNSRLTIDRETISVLGPMAVRFQFLNYPPIEVCEGSFAPSTKPLMEEKSILMKSGKSCMFSLKSEKIFNQSSFNIYLTVYQYKLERCYPGQKPGKPQDVFIGRTKINMSDVFQEMFKETLEPSGRLTRSKTACSKLVDNQGVEVGKIMFMVRVSCFGFMVMTGFQLPEEQQKDFKYKHIEFDSPGETEPEKEISTTAFNQLQSPPAVVCTECQSSGEPQKQTKTNKGEKDRIKDKGRHERKEKKKTRDKAVDMGTQPAAPCPFGLPPCACPCRPPANNMSAYAASVTSSPAPSQSAAPNRARNMDIDPGAVGIRGNQLVFKMPEQQTTPQVAVEGKFASSVYYKMDDENQNGARNVIQILPKNPNLEIDKSKVDEKQDVLVLKLGKKRMAAGKRPKLELELRTPKMKEEKPTTDVKDTQYLLSDLPKPPKGKGASKAGSKKGKKK